MNKKNAIRREDALAYAMVSPAIIYMTLVMAIPLGWGIYLSFTNKVIGTDATFIWLDNYIKLLHDKVFINSIFNTVKFTFFSIAGKAFLGLLLALVLNMNFKGRNFVRAAVLIPWTLPNIVSVLNWRWMFSDAGGILNHIFRSLGFVDQNILWLGTSGLAMLSVIIVNVWRGTPFFGISILSKLQTIPVDLYEAAYIDGANTLQKFFYITLPSIIDVITLSALVSTIWTVNEFETVWLLTGGGPVNATQLISIYSYKSVMVNLEIGKSVAISVLSMPILILLIALVTGRTLGNTGEEL